MENVEKLETTEKKEINKKKKKTFFKFSNFLNGVKRGKYVWRNAYTNEELAGSLARERWVGSTTSVRGRSTADVSLSAEFEGKRPQYKSVWF